MAGQDNIPNDDELQTQGRKANAAQPLDASDNEGGAERYPPTRQDDAVSEGEQRSFAENPQPRQGAGDGGPPPSTNEGRLGPGGDPAEGKR
jgi:hypothetical protein